MLNFVLCDDNLSVLDRFEKMLNSLFLKHDFDAQIAFKSDSADDVLSYVRNNTVNVLILDINLQSTISGIELAAKVRQCNKKVYIIFTTGHLEYAMVAYKVKTFDYLAKPITTERLEDTIVRLFDDIYNTPKKYLKLSNKSIINQDDIHFIKKDGMKVVVYTNTDQFETYSSFSKIQNSLSDSFVRCHKSYIANINNITNVEATNNVIRFDENECYIGPKYKNYFMDSYCTLNIIFIKYKV